MLVLNRDENDALGRARSLPHQHHARQPDPLPGAHTLEVASVAAAEFAQLWAQQGKRVLPQVSIGTELGPQIGTQKGPSCEVC